MTNTNEATWYQMMGLSKIFLRNFVIGCFMLLILATSTLIVIVDRMSIDAVQREREHNKEMADLRKECDAAKELKNTEYIKMLKEALENQRLIDREIEELKSSYPRKMKR